jgi:hypothetical protein
MICAEEIDRKFPDGWGLSFDYRIPGECTNREQRRLKKMHGTEIIKSFSSVFRIGIVSYLVYN